MQRRVQYTLERQAKRDKAPKVDKNPEVLGCIPELVNCNAELDVFLIKASLMGNDDRIMNW